MEMTNALRKQIQSLNETKHRRELQMFKAEGTKCVLDTINSFKLRYLIATYDWLKKHDNLSYQPNLIQVSPKDMERMSSFSTASQVLAVYDIPQRSLDADQLKNQLSIALDCIQDPGNLGTIIRTADWFGIRTILASRDTVDMFSPKVVQATMGAISRVHVHYVDLPHQLDSLCDIPIYGTFLNGENIYTSKLKPHGIIVMGNEGKGISTEVGERVTDRLLIPSFPPDQMTSESLNVATATAIVVAEFRRQAGL